jgi:hypothetical protein
MLDCKTDVIFNTLSLLFPLIGHQVDIWWLDPGMGRFDLFQPKLTIPSRYLVGAGLLSVYIIYDWSATSFENVTRLSGVAVSESIEQKLIFLAYRFAPVVDGIKSVTAYHAGDKVWAEYDLLLPETMPLGLAHDIAETLQYCCEGRSCSSQVEPMRLTRSDLGLEEVDRAFVTTDCKHPRSVLTHP